MVQHVPAVGTAYHLYLFQLVYRRGHVHEVALLLVLQFRVLQARVDAVAHHERDELDEDLRGRRLVGVHAHAPVAQVGLVAAEEFLGAVAALVEVHGLGSRHLLRGDYHEVSAQFQLVPDDVLSGLRVEELVALVEQFEVVADNVRDEHLAVLGVLQEASHAAYLLLYRGPLASELVRVEDHVQVAVFGVVGVQPRVHGGAVDAVGLHVAVRVALELAADRVHHRRDEPAHAPRHDDEREPVLVHEPDVVAAEVAAVQDEAHVVVAVALRLREHELQLAHVHDAAGVLLVEERLAVFLVVGDGVVEDGRTAVLLGVAVLDHLYVARLAVLVRRVVRDVDAVPALAPYVPAFQELGDLVLRHLREERGHGRVGVAPHPRREHGVVVGVVGVVLRRVVLGYERVCREIAQQPVAAVVEDAVQCEVELGLGEHPAHQQERPYPQAAADAAADGLVGQRDRRQVLAEVLVGREPACFRVEFADGGPLRQGVAPLRVVFAAVFVVDVGRAPDRPRRYQPGEVGNVHEHVQDHLCASLFRNKSA